MDDTITAISTALGVGAISIIRISGKDAIEIANNIFSGKDLQKENSHTIHYGYILDGQEKIDEVLISIMKEPKTFTRENVVEINCHGGIASTKKILELLLKNGCRLAEPGEFTKRAFLNGRIDLVEAEGVMDLISSKTELARSVAMNQLSGEVSKLIHKLREQIIEVIANIEVNIDYPEYEDIKEIEVREINPLVKKIKEELNKIIKKSENSKIIKDGINTVIIGKPNVGKSSILNKIIDEDKAIVTDIPGTTRDIVEGTYNLDGIILNIIDTAGIRKTDDVVEKIGVEKSFQFISTADLVILVLNNHEPLTEEEIDLMKQIKDKNHIVLLNKVDLENQCQIKEITNQYIEMSVKDNIGFEELKNKIKELFNLEHFESQDINYLVNTRSLSILKDCYQKIIEVENNIDENMPIDMLEIDLREIWNLLGQIIGETYEEELLDELFKRFCLGK